MPHLQSSTTPQLQPTPFANNEHQTFETTTEYYNDIILAIAFLVTTLGKIATRCIISCLSKEKGMAMLPSLGFRRWVSDDGFPTLGKDRNCVACCSRRSPLLLLNSNISKSSANLGTVTLSSHQCDTTVRCFLAASHTI